MRSEHQPAAVRLLHRVCVPDQASGNVDSSIPDQKIHNGVDEVGDDIPYHVGVESVEYVVPNGELHPNYGGAQFGTDWPEGEQRALARVEVTPNFVNCRMCVERD